MNEIFRNTPERIAVGTFAIPLWIAFFWATAQVGVSVETTSAIVFTALAAVLVRSLATWNRELR